jgi:thiol-disulfide isomerase/thioredoxin
VNLVPKYLLVSLTLLLLASCQQPDFLDTRGNGHRYADLEGKWLIVNYWATWCGPCIKEIPELNKIAEEYEDRVNVFGVNFDQPDAGEMQAQVKKMRIEFPVFAIDPAAELGITRPDVLPTTFVFSADGSLHTTLIGPQTEDSVLAVLDIPAPIGNETDVPGEQQK